MAQYLDSIDKFFFPRSTRFPDQFMDDVKALVGMATSEIIEQFSQVRVCSAFVTGSYIMIQAFVLRINYHNKNYIYTPNDHDIPSYIAFQLYSGSRLFQLN